jgi:hypothetical protein
MTGNRQRWSSSISPCWINVRENEPVPNFRRSAPGCSFRSATAAAAAASPSRTVAFQVVSSRVVDATYLGRALMRSEYASPLRCG